MCLCYGIVFIKLLYCSIQSVLKVYLNIMVKIEHIGKESCQLLTTNSHFAILIICNLTKIVSYDDTRYFNTEW